MLIWGKKKDGNYRAVCGTTYTIKKRPDGWFDLYAGRKKLNDERGRLGTLKAVAEMNEEDAEHWQDVAGLPGNQPGYSPEGKTATEVAADFGEHQLQTDRGPIKVAAQTVQEAVRLAVKDGYAVLTPTPLGADHQPLPEGWLIDVLTEDDAVKRLESLTPKARDMVDRATTLLPALPMPGAERRTLENDDSDVPLQVEADWHFLYTWEGQTAVTLDREDFLDPAAAFARVPRGTARKLRKALRAAGRGDLAAVSRRSPEDVT